MLTKADFTQIISEVKYGTWDFYLGEDTDRLYLQVQFNETDSVTGKMERQYCRKFYLSSHMVKQEVVRTAWKAIEAAVLHEASEHFKYKGRAIYGPHLSPDALWKVARQVEYRGKSD